ncbi:bile salt sulfotransferase 1-like [Sigmodon hispidus]
MSDYLWFEGIPFPALGYEKETIELVKKFVIRDEDTIILSYPKSGTNWIIETVCLIQTKGDPKWVESVPVWERSPWVETQIGYSQLIHQEGPRLISSHVPLHLFPKTLFSSKAKVIYIIRNPRDILVSSYFFFGKTNLMRNPESFRTYFEWFLKGNVSNWHRHSAMLMSGHREFNYAPACFQKKETYIRIIWFRKKYHTEDWLPTKLQRQEVPSAQDSDSAQRTRIDHEWRLIQALLDVMKPSMQNIIALGFGL